MEHVQKTSSNTDCPSIILKIHIPSLNCHKSINVSGAHTIWSIKKTLNQKVSGDLQDALNFGIYLQLEKNKPGRFLEEYRTVQSYNLNETSMLQFMLKHNPMSNKKVCTKKNQKKCMEAVSKQNREKVDKLAKEGFDFNFVSENGETPLTLAAMFDIEANVINLVERKAMLDFRRADGKTALHVAAMNSKKLALEVLIRFGSWVESTDNNGLTPIYYASTAGSLECVKSLLEFSANPNCCDDNGRTVLHQACAGSFEAIVSLLIDFGANLDAVNEVGNTALHIAAAKNAKECVKKLLIRGASREIVNKSGKNAHQTAVVSGNIELGDMIKNFKESDIVPPPPPPPCRINISYIDKGNNEDNIHELASPGIVPNTETSSSEEELDTIQPIAVLKAANSVGSLLTSPPVGETSNEPPNASRKASIDPSLLKTIAPPPPPPPPSGNVTIRSNASGSLKSQTVKGSTLQNVANILSMSPDKIPAPPAPPPNKQSSSLKTSNTTTANYTELERRLEEMTQRAERAERENLRLQNELNLIKQKYGLH